MTKDAQAITAAIVIMGFIIALTLERIAKVLEKQKPIGKSQEAEELNSIAHFLMQIRDNTNRRRRETADPKKLAEFKREMVQAAQDKRDAMVASMQKGREMLENLEAENNG